MIALELAIGAAAGVGVSHLKALTRGWVAAALIIAVLTASAVMWVALGASSGWPFAAFAIAFAVTSACGGAVIERRKRTGASRDPTANAGSER
jgi:uncharacterized membrane protein